MEPASIVGLVGSVASLLVLTGKVSKDIHGIATKYTSITSTLQDIDKECLLMSAGLRQVKGRLDESRSGRAADDNSVLQLCLESFTITLTRLQQEITRLLKDNKASGFRLRKSKMSFLWNEEILKDHCQQVRNERDALHFVISSWNLSPPDSRRQMRQVARAASIRHSRRGDGTSVFSRDAVPHFETVIAQSAVYQNLGGLHRMDEEEQENWQTSHHSPSKGTTLVVIKEYDSGQAGHLQLEAGDLVQVVEKSEGALWVGRLREDTGSFPIACCDTKTPLVDSASVDSIEAKLAAMEALMKATHEPHDNFHKIIALLQTESQIDEAYELWEQAGKSRQIAKFTDSLGWTLLHYAARYDTRHVKDGAIRLWFRDDDSQGDALRKRAFELITGLVEAGADINATSLAGATPIAIAAAHNYSITADISGPNTIDTLLALGADKSVTYENGDTLLHVCAREGAIVSMKSLLKSGMPIESRNADLDTPLHVAATRGDIAMVETLKDNRSHVISRNKKRETPLFVAARCGHKEVWRTLCYSTSTSNYNLQAAGGLWPLHGAALAGKAEMCNALLDLVSSEIQVRAKDNSGRGVLHCAVESNIVQSLRARDALQPVLNSKTNAGLAPLHLAAQLGHEESGIALLDLGADIRVEDGAGWTPLHYAAKYGQEQVAHMLLERGGKALCLRKEPASAWSAGNSWLVAFLVAVASYNSGIQMAMIVAVVFGLIPYSYVLITIARTPFLETTTPLHLSATHNQLAVARLLLDVGAPKEAKDVKGLTPLDCAKSEKHNDMVDLLVNARALVG